MPSTAPTESKAAALFAAAPGRPRPATVPDAAHRKAAAARNSKDSDSDSDSDDSAADAEHAKADQASGKRARDAQIEYSDSESPSDDDADDDVQQKKGSSDTSTAKKSSKEKLSAADEAARLARTVFVGNLPTDIKSKAVRKHFATFGGIEAVRLRSAAAANPKMSKKAAVITRELAGDAISAYVVYTEAASVAPAVRSSGDLVFGRHLRVDAASRPGESSAAAKQHDVKRSVFLGNLPHTVSEESIWRLFEPCGTITYVRLIRESKTQLGKGFGYVGFAEAGSVERALALHGTKVAGASDEAEAGAAAERAIRVFRCSQGKSHARLTGSFGGGAGASAAGSAASGQQGRGSRGDGGGKSDDADPASAADSGDQAKGAKHNQSVGWQQRVRRRLQKKLVGKAKLRKEGGKEAGGDSLQKLKSAIDKTKNKAAERSAVRGGGKTKSTARARRETKHKALRKRERSKLNSGKRKPRKDAAPRGKRGQ